jgi:hypothetical protein
MSSEHLTPDPTPLIASLAKKARAAGVTYDFEDAAFARKMARLMAMVPREYEIHQAFEAFLADPVRGATPFHFPDKFDKYRKARPALAPEKPAEPSGPSCPCCGNKHLLPGTDDLSACPMCRKWFDRNLREVEVPRVAEVVPPWRRDNTHEQGSRA